MKSKILQKFADNHYLKKGPDSAFKEMVNDVNVEKIELLASCTLSFFGTYLLNTTENLEEEKKVMQIVGVEGLNIAKKKHIALIKRIEEIIEIITKKGHPPGFIHAAASLAATLAIQIENCNEITHSELKNNIDDLVGDLFKDDVPYESEVTQFEINTKDLNVYITFNKFFNKDTEVIARLNLKTQTHAIINKDINNIPSDPNVLELLPKVLAKVAHTALRAESPNLTKRISMRDGFIKKFEKPYKVTIKASDTVKEHPEIPELFRKS